MLLDVVLVIDQQHGDIVVSLDDAEEEVHIHCASRHIAFTAFIAQRCQFLSGVGPDFHALALLHGKVFNQIIGDVQEQGDQQ